MKRKLESIIDQLGQAQSLEALQDQVFQIRDLYEVEHLVYHSVNSTGQQYAALTYEDAWVDHYIETDLARVDPVVKGCFQRFHPVDWKRLDWSSKKSRDFLGEAVAEGVGNQGFSVPIRGPNGQFALFSVNQKCGDEEWEKFTDRSIQDLILVAHYLNQTALRIERGTDEMATRALSPREKDALTMLALGYSRAQAAESLSISPHTLRVYIEAAQFKLGAANTTHAVARAMAQGLLVV
ncbi:MULTISPECIES: helix-turn-helix transcriptional regulator [Falsihalocynthiibacter]|uniref:helix-turn-helix transcriptional regulator n=1 Tax=Falsihalocynthiibacter TaxID=2854182 RepID=UPI003002B172